MTTTGHGGMDVRTDGGSQVKRATIARGPTETIAIMEGWRLCVWMGPMIGATTAPFQMPLSFIVRRCCPPARPRGPLSEGVCCSLSTWQANLHRVLEGKNGSRVSE